MSPCIHGKYSVVFLRAYVPDVLITIFFILLLSAESIFNLHTVTFEFKIQKMKKKIIGTV